MISDTILLDIIAKVDAQMKAERAKKPAGGDRRRTQGQPPEGMQERRINPDRRYYGRKN